MSRAQYVRPWCVVDSDSTGPGTLRPVGFTMAEISEVLLRVTLANCTAEFDTGNAAPYDIESVNEDVATNMVNERTPICAGTVGMNFELETAPESPFPGSTVLVRVNLWNANDTFGPAVYDGTLYWPVLMVEVIGAALVGRDLISYWTYLGSPSPTATVVTCSIFGKSVTLMNVSTDPDFLSGSVVVEPAAANAFLEYRDADGNNPIWEKTTGAQLITPLPMS